jgi:hypothetical protein
LNSQFHKKCQPSPGKLNVTKDRKKKKKRQNEKVRKMERNALKSLLREIPAPS